MNNKKQIKNFLFEFWATTCCKYINLKTKIYIFSVIHYTKVDFVLNFIFRQWLSFMCNIDIFCSEYDILSMLETIKLEDKLEIQEMKKIIQEEIQPILENNLNNGIERTASGNIQTAHLVLTSAKILGTMYDDANIYIDISKTLIKSETPTVRTYIGDLTIFNHAEYNSAKNYIEQDMKADERCNIKKVVLQHMQSTTDNPKRLHQLLIREFKFPSKDIIYEGRTITTNPIVGRHDPVAFYHGNVLSEHYTQVTDFEIEGLPQKPVGTNSYIAHMPKYFMVSEKEVIKYQEYYFSELLDIQKKIRNYDTLSNTQKKQIEHFCKILNICYSNEKELKDLVVNLKKEELFRMVQEKTTDIPKSSLKTPQAQQTFDEISEKLKTHTYLPELYKEKFNNIRFPQELSKYAINTPKHTTFITENYNTITKLITSIKQSKKI